MLSSFRLPENERMCILALALVFLLTRLPILFTMPFVQDEGLYSIMIGEQRLHPALIPTFLDSQVSWKPPLFFWAYAAFPELPISPEASFRLPSFLFGLATVPLLYMFLRNTGASKNISFFTVLIFLLSLPSIYPNSALLTDTLLFFFICASLYLYSEGRFGDWRFAAAGALAFCAFFTKLVIAVIVPLLVLAYFYQKRKEILRNRIFLLSLLAVPLAFACHFLLLETSAMGKQLYLSDIGGHLVTSSITDQLGTFIGSLVVFIFGAGIWFALSLFGLWRFWRDNLVMSLWYLLTIFPMLTGYYMVWYYLPVMPAIAYFAALTLLKWDGKEKPDLFFAFFFCLAATLILAGIIMFYFNIYSSYLPEKEAGTLLSGKENVLIAGGYKPAMLSYKVLPEMEVGRRLDFGLIIAPTGLPSENMSRLLQDYLSPEPATIDGSFSALFTSNSTFRKSTNITSFDYVALVDYPELVPQNAQIIYNRSNITIYRVK